MRDEGEVVGVGVPRKPAVKLVQSVGKKPLQAVTGSDGAVQYFDKPCVGGQLRAARVTCRIGPGQSQVFRLNDSEQLEKYNKLKTMAYPEDAPSVLLDERVEFYNGEFISLVVVHSVTYQHFVGTGEKNDGQ